MAVNAATIEKRLLMPSINTGHKVILIVHSSSGGLAAVVEVPRRSSLSTSINPSCDPHVYATSLDAQQRRLVALQHGPMRSSTDAAHT